MAYSNASIQVSGNVGRDDAELRKTRGGTQICKFSMAVQVGYDDGESITQWYQVQMFGASAEYFADKVKARQQVFVQGMLELNRWTGRDGERHETWVITATQIALVRNSGAPRREEEVVVEDEAGGFADDDEDDEIPF